MTAAHKHSPPWRRPPLSIRERRQRAARRQRRVERERQQTNYVHSTGEQEGHE